MIMEEEFIVSDKTIDKIVNWVSVSSDEILEKLLPKLEDIYNKRRINQRTECKKNTVLALKGIDLKNVKQIEESVDYKDAYVLFKDGKLFKNRKYIDNNVDRLIHLIASDIYKVTKDKQIIPLEKRRENWTKFNEYVYNEGKPYKKILIDGENIFALTEQGRIINTQSMFAEVGIIPENFINVEDILYVKQQEESNALQPYIVKNNKKMPLYIR